MQKQKYKERMEKKTLNRRLSNFDKIKFGNNSAEIEAQKNVKIVLR